MHELHPTIRNPRSNPAFQHTTTCLSRIAKMEQFLIDNAAHYLKLVGAFKPAHNKAAKDTVNPDMVVAARIRPMLDDESAQGFPECIFPRASAPNTVDVHELRKAVRGPPSLNASTMLLTRLPPANSSSPSTT